MACKTSFELHHNFPKLAEESGFTFNTHKPRVHIEWNKIKLIDIESLIRERRFIVVEQHINDILDCVLESEFDVRILDEGVLKIFRLAQLAVEYQQFCRHYLDRSVFVLREEINNLLQELETTKKCIKEKEEEIKKLRRKTKHPLRPTLPYGNENIATMILKTLNQNKGELFASTSQMDPMHYNKCGYCDKVFLNQLYLKGHISRRHADAPELLQKDTINQESKGNSETNSKLNDEIADLRDKLKKMEELIENSTSKPKTHVEIQTNMDKNEQNIEVPNNVVEEVLKNTKDTEVSTNEEGNILDKIEEWKKEEHEKYNKEINLLRQQISEIVSNKERQEQWSIQNELKMMEQLNVTIKEQGAEILALKQELQKGENTETQKIKEIESQMAYWANKAEIQSKEYNSLLHKLNKVSNEAHELRACAVAEKEKANQLQELLHQQLNNPSKLKESPGNKKRATQKSQMLSEQMTTEIKIRNSTPDITLKKLQQKAQELLNIEQSSTLDSSSVSDEKEIGICEKSTENHNIKQEQNMKAKPKTYSKSCDKIDELRIKNKEKKKYKTIAKKDSKHNTGSKMNGYAHIPGSPNKIMRAKITEEVNHRLTSLGVDPLKRRLPQNIFQKQRMLLQEHQNIKSKKFPAREKVLHTIMAHLNQTITSTTKFSKNEYISPNKSPKNFSLSSVLSNVKTKALSLVKSHESLNKNSNKSYDDVAKKAMALLKTPPGSAPTSPVKQGRGSFDSPNKKLKTLNDGKHNAKKYVNLNKKSSTRSVTYFSNDSDSEMDDSEYKSKVIKQLVKSPVRRPTNDLPERTFNTKDEIYYKETDIEQNDILPDFKPDNTIKLNVNKKAFLESKDNSSDDIESLIDTSPRKNVSEENLTQVKQTKGVLKNASSTSSLNKKKVLFDMDAIQMKSVSASPSQSVTEKSDINQHYEAGIVNLVTEEWDISSSIENEPTKSTTKIQITSHTSPKIAELKQTIESQLTRRNPTLSTVLVGGVDVLAAPIHKATSLGGSNTSLGSSILDDTDSAPLENKAAIIKSKIIADNDDSEIEISDLINDGLESKNFNKSF